MKRSSVRRWALIVAGILALLLGAVGIFVPLLPTTPFLLLAAACFLRSSDRLYRWLMAHRLFGEMIRSYREYHAISMPAKIGALGLLWTSLAYAAFVVARTMWLHCLLLIIAVGVTLHLLSLRTLTREMRGRLGGAEDRETEDPQ